MKHFTIKSLTIGLLFLIMSMPNTLFALGGGGGGGGGGLEQPCSGAQPFCSDENYDFGNEYNSSAPSGPDYGCLGSEPNPIWYFMKIGETGPIQLHLEQQNNNNNGIDIDFAMWGPFSDVTTGCNQIMSGNEHPLQCSYSASSTETIGLGMSGGYSGGASTPPVPQAGEYYIVILTNYNGSEGHITLEQTGGTGNTDCSIVIPCSIDNITATATCNDDVNSFSVSGEIEFEDAPDTGDLIVEDCNGNSTSYPAPFTSPISYTIPDISPDGETCQITAHFSEETLCKGTSADYQNPDICVCIPPVLTLNEIGICDGVDFDLNNAIDPSSDAATSTFYNSQADATNASNAISNTANTPGTYWIRAETLSSSTCFEVYEITVGNSSSQDPSFDFEDFCEGASNGPSNIASPGGQYSFNSAVTDGATINGTTGKISNGIEGTVYTVEYALGGACPTSGTQDVTVNPTPDPQFEADEVMGCEPHFVNFTNLSNNTGGTCFWDFGDGDISTVCDDVPHTYLYEDTFDVTLTITDALGCTGTHTEYNYIEVLPKPVAQFSADPMITGTSDPVVNFTNETKDGGNFKWTFGDDTPPDSTIDPTHIFPDEEGGDYIVTLIASNGPDCSDTVKAIIKIEDELIFYIPDAFTPDDDEYNQVFKPIFTSGFDPQTYSLFIYDRWGEIVFESHNTDIGWDGSYGENSSKVIKQGIYIWEIKVKETGRDKRDTYTGHVSLLK